MGLVQTPAQVVSTNKEIAALAATFEERVKQALHHIVSRSEPWLIARHSNTSVDGDSLPELFEELQITLQPFSAHPLFYVVASDLPMGWHKLTAGEVTTIYNYKTPLIRQHFKPSLTGGEAYIEVIKKLKPVEPTS